MPSAKIVSWEDDGNWIGYLQEFPDDWPQGDTLEDLNTQLRDLYQELTSGELPGIRRVGDIAVACNERRSSKRATRAAARWCGTEPGMTGTAIPRWGFPSPSRAIARSATASRSTSWRSWIAAS